LEFRKKFAGQTLDVITLQAGNENSTEALSDNYLKVRIQGRLPQNKLMTVKIFRIVSDGLLGETLNVK
jgi:hypothetical protein